ncbi:MAG: 4-hydroxybenzoate octaprenyltransferase, partial [Pseudomonadota bacterium]
AVALGVASLGLVAIYPFAKRFTWWPQVFLGLAINWGALLAWTAHTGSLHPAPLALYAAGIAWTLFYDTIYACQDKEDDALIGVKSTARLFEGNTHRWLRYFLMMSLSLFLLAVVLSAPGNILTLTISLCGIWAMGWHLLWQLRSLDPDDGALCMRLFRSNRNAGLIPTLFLLLALLA